MRPTGRRCSRRRRAQAFTRDECGRARRPFPQTSRVHGNVMSQVDRRLRTAVIGCGAIANEHLSYLSRSRWTELAAVCDVSPISASFAQERFGASSGFTDVTAMLRDAQPDVVHVLTPPQTHTSLIRMSLDQSAHVICEKPMTASANETEAL